MDGTDRDGEHSEDGSLDETLPSDDHGPSTLTRTTGPSTVPEIAIERGTEIGRYVVVERVGSGTMGLVVSAFDPALDRKVAIKLVRLDPIGSTSGRQRLMREAQAMAKLQHPNVVTVFEVGTFEEQDLVSIGLVLAELERFDEALDHQQRAMAIFELHPEDNRHEMSTALYDLGLAYMNVHRTKEGMATLQRALDSAQTEHGPDSDDVASVLAAMMDAMDATGDHVRARDYGQRALAIREKTGGDDHQNVARVLGDLAHNAIEREQPREAMQLIDRALSIIDKPGAPPLAVKFVMLQIRATAELALARAGDALADARASRDGFLASEQPMAAADVRLTVADAMWMQKRRRDAVAEVKTALDTLQGLPKPDPDLLAKVRTWLADHAAP